ncbi:MAG: hypothetical protein ABL900_08045 [Burkholderiaceae bacterium]
MLSIALSGCAPTYDWREVRPDGAALTALFPCRPQHLSRNTELAGLRLPMQVHVCDTPKETFAVGFLDVEHPAQVAAALASLRAAVQVNFSATQIQVAPLRVPGMTPNPNAVLVSMHGVSARGLPVRVSAAFFARGLRVYQATAFGGEVDPEVLHTFVAGLRLQ